MEEENKFVEAAKESYVEGELTEREFEQALEDAMDTNMSVSEFAEKYDVRKLDLLPSFGGEKVYY